MQSRGTTQDPAPAHDPAGPETAGASADAPSAFVCHGVIPPVADAPGDAGGGAATASELAYDHGGGAPLPDDVRRRFEVSLGADLSAVRVHTGAAAAANARRAGARALAVGTDIHFADGQYDPHGAAGAELLAHEVAHTVQQRDASPRPQAARGDAMPGPTDTAEVEADHAARAMVAGAPAQVSPVAHQAPHAKEAPAKEDPGSWKNLIKALDGARARSDWNDVALRLNGLSTDDIRWYLEQKMKGLYGQVAHVRAAAPHAMPGFSHRVVEEIDAFDKREYGSKLGQIAALYEAYDKAVVTARASHDWKDVIDRLNGMGEPDLLSRLRKLTWAEHEEIRAQTDNKRVLDAVDKADRQREADAARAYATAIQTKDFDRAAMQLHAMSSAGLEKAIEALYNDPTKREYLRYIKAAALRVIPDSWPQRVVNTIDWIAAVEYGTSIDLIEREHLVAIPDISDDTRELKSISLANFADNKAIAKFASELAYAYESKRAAVPKDKRNKDSGDHHPAPESFADKIDELRKSWEATAKHYVTTGWFPTVAQFGSRWMVEVREKGERFAGESWVYANPKTTDKAEFAESRLETLRKPPGVADLGQKVHPWVNEFMSRLGADYGASTYPHHGEALLKKDKTTGKEEWSGDWAPLALDVTPIIKLDERGFYDPEQMFDFIKRIDHAADGLWAGIYNDTSLIRHAQANGFAGKLSSTADDLGGTHNFHGPLNPHIHLYLKPPTENWVPHPTSAPKVDPDEEPKG